LRQDTESVLHDGESLNMPCANRLRCARPMPVFWPVRLPPAMRPAGPAGTSVGGKLRSRIVDNGGIRREHTAFLAIVTDAAASLILRFRFPVAPARTNEEGEIIRRTQTGGQVQAVLFRFIFTEVGCIP
jgi:hypothetical protein